MARRKTKKSVIKRTKKVKIAKSPSTILPVETVGPTLLVTPKPKLPSSSSVEVPESLEDTPRRNPVENQGTPVVVQPPPEVPEVGQGEETQGRPHPVAGEKIETVVEPPVELNKHGKTPEQVARDNDAASALACCGRL
ncbi:hypothetical protein KAR91_08800 [Candidatus Pacearchaeota archaeon]|nr:hypothetical protein [Candidatus Pacearchaeota archaeon]